MASLMGVIPKAAKSFMEAATISVDNWTFKCFYRISTTVLIACSVAATARQFFGSPIICDAGKVRSTRTSKYLLGQVCCRYASANDGWMANMC